MSSDDIVPQGDFLWGVKDLHRIKDRRSGRRPGGVFRQMHFLFLQARKPALHRRIVAQGQASRSQQLPRRLIDWADGVDAFGIDMAQLACFG